MYLAPRDPALGEVYATRGPFLSVYLDLTRAPEDGIEVVDERWAVVRDGLPDADPDDLDAIEESVSTELTRPSANGARGAYGMVAVAADGRLCLGERLGRAPARSTGRVSALPDVVPYLLTRAPTVANLVIAARAGQARLLQFDRGRLAVLGATPPVAAVTDQEVAALARTAARAAAQIDPQVVVVVGDGDTTSRVARTVERVLVTEVATAPADAGDRSISAAAAQLLQAHQDRSGVAAVASMREALARRDASVAGTRDVLTALRTAATDLVVVTEPALLDEPCWVGSRPTEVWLREDVARDALGERPYPDLIGAAVVRAAFATDAVLVLGPVDGLAPTQGIVARLA